MRETEEGVAVSDQPDCPVDLSRASLTGDSQEGFKGSDVDVSKVWSCVRFFDTARSRRGVE